MPLLLNGCPALCCERLQLVSPRSIISLSSLSRKLRLCSNLSKEATGSLGGRYQATTRKGLLCGSIISTQINSRLFSGLDICRYLVCLIFVFVASDQKQKTPSMRGCKNISLVDAPISGCFIARDIMQSDSMEATSKGAYSFSWTTE